MTSTAPVLDARAARGELIEATALEAFVRDAAPATHRELGVRTTRIGGAAVLAVAHDPTHYWSKAVGLGATEPLTREIATDVVRFWERGGVALGTMPIAPAALPPDWPEIAADLGLAESSRWVKLQRDLTLPVPGPAPRTRLRVGPMSAEEHAPWVRVLMGGFGMPPVFEGLGAVTDPAVVRRFGAWDGPELVAAASLVVDGDTAGLFGAATLPGHRLAGAQSALIGARLQAAADAGVRWVDAETGTETAESPNSSLHNLRRAGLVGLYERPNWVWRRR